LLPRPSLRHRTFLLDGRKHLRLINVSRPDILAYRILLAEGGAS
jgi:hypothetical protein